ncbi:tyrosine phosphatase family-domain-containing protein [Catenaria anguillulae PL171]|uniref:Tyrosine phosphatase family-domain-containing protein n=1 Tax=Catenaria anguillulae PL171 TaxID=765915 RepID=A0A1Y2HHN6_9FUNG|nr:tyrosine phosphatase family-domain-containing protein [Catenaria anguillulae PL171]
MNVPAFTMEPTLPVPVTSPSAIGANAIMSVFAPTSSVPSMPATLSRPPILVPPLNFAMVASGVYRSGYPNKKNFAFLKTLHLKSVIYLDPDDYAPDNLAFLDSENIAFLQLPIKGNKEPFVEIDSKLVRQVLEFILDPLNRPALIHCHKGKHRVGCVVGCLRKLCHWSSTAIFAEYRRFAGDKIRIADQEFIEMFDANATGPSGAAEEVKHSNKKTK